MLNNVTFLKITTEQEFKQIHELFTNVLEELRKYYVDKTIDEELKLNNYDAFVKKYSTKDNFAFLLKHQDKPIGFMLVKIEEGIATLEWAGIHQDYRKKGFGKLLKLETEKFLLAHTNTHKMVCDCLISNTESVKSLQSAGFSVVTKLNNHWHHQDYYWWEKIIR